MRSLKSVGLGLSVVFTCLLLSLVAVIYYLLWWKRRIIRATSENDHTNSSRKSSYISRCKTQAPSTVNIFSNTQMHQEFYFHPQNKPFDGQNGSFLREEWITSGSPRFLFTIKEETKEEMEMSQDEKTNTRKSLQELMKNMEITPCVSPFSSPLFLTPYSTPMNSWHSSGNHVANFGGYNPLYECSNEDEFNRIVKYSPPPTFKFLRNAEEKLIRKTMMIEQDKREKALKARVDGSSSITIILA